MLGVKENIELVRQEINKAALRANRDPKEINLICVSKNQTIEAIQEALTVGERLFGENRVQELLEKYPQFSNNVSWHLIGHLQTNKVKYIVDKVGLVHSVDRLSLAIELNKKALQAAKKVPVLIQVNVAQEDSKFGLATNETMDFLKEVSPYPGIEIMGLMTMAPYTEKQEEVRWVFKELKLLQEKIIQANIPRVTMQHLSMGMTNDYQVAIEEGATLVRIGSGIFGERNYL